MLPRPCLMLVTDRSLAQGVSRLVNDVTAAVEGGVNAVQVREKDLTSEALLDLVVRLRNAIHGEALVLVNDNPAVALAAGADGVHGGESSLSVRAMRRAIRERMLIGRSVHTLQSAGEAVTAGADYLQLGTIFPSRSHPHGETGGIERVLEVTAAVEVPVIAIGGITGGNAAEVMRAGAAGVAVISAILGTPDPHAASRTIREAIENAIRTLDRNAPMVRR